MSILQFMEMNVTECFLYSVFAILICVAYSGIGRIFIPKRGIMIQSVLGMTFMGAIGVLCAEFCAGLMKYLIFIFAIIGLANLAIGIARHEVKIRNLLISIIPVLLFYSIAFANILCLVLPENGIFHYNCHQTYFSGVPLELLQADYFSRIRIMDVYPYEWSKYHFFNGASISIPLIAFIKKNYISYLFAKMVVICFYVGAIYDLLKDRYGTKKAWLHLMIGVGAFFICAYTGISWSIETNNFSCIFMMLIAWLFFEEKDYSGFTMFSIGYAITKSGSTISGGCLFLYGLYKMYKNDGLGVKAFFRGKYKEAIFCIIVGLGILSMVFIGKNASGDSSLIFGSIYPIFYEMFSVWAELMPMGGVVLMENEVFMFEFLYMAVIVYLLIKNFDFLLGLITKYKKIAVFVFVCSLLYLIGALYLHRNFNFIFVAFLVWYALPLLSVLASVKDGAIEIYIVFVISLGINFILFKAGVTMPNYCIIAFVSLALFTRQFILEFLEKSITWRGMLYVITVVGMAYFSTYNWKEILFMPVNDNHHATIELETVEYSEEPFEYYSASDAKLAKLNALKANRVHYNILPNIKDEAMSEISMAMGFLPMGYEKELK